MSRQTLVVRRNGCLREPRDAQRLLERLVAQPGVESARVEASPLCVVLQVASEHADVAGLRALVRAQRVEIERRECEPAPAPQLRVRPPSVPPAAGLRFASAAPSPR